MTTTSSGLFDERAQPPGAVLGDYAHAVHGDQVAERLAGDFFSARFDILKIRTTFAITWYFFSSSQCGDIVGVPQVWQRAAQVPPSISPGCGRACRGWRVRRQPVVVAAADRLAEK